MKKTLILAAAAALVLSSCLKDENAVSKDTKVSFVVDGPISRVTTADNVTSFEAGDEIAITSSGLAEDITSEVYVYANGGLTGKEVNFNGETPATFVAYYPTSAVLEAGALTFTVPSIQTADNFHKSMLMVAQAEGSAAAPTVNLQFCHKLAWVKVVLNNIEAAKVDLCNIAPTVTWTADALTAGGAATEIQTWKQGETQVYWALVPAQTVEAGKRFISLTTAEGTTFEYTLTEALTLSTAKVKTVTLSRAAEGGDEVIKASFSVDAANDAAWEDDVQTDLSGDITEVEAPAIELISADAGDFSKITALNPTVTGWANAKTAGWALILNGANSGAVGHDTEAGEILMSRATDNTAWYKVGVVYYTGENVKAGTYTLVVNTRNLDATVDGTSDDIQLRVFETMAETQTQIGSTQTIATNPELTSAKREITLEKDYPGGISFMFYPKSNDGFTYAIQSVTVIEKK